MEWVLAEALLSQSWDPRVLLGALCRGEASAERVETLCFLLQRLEDEEARGGCGRGALPEAAREVAAGYLVPLLRGLRGRPAGGSDPGPPARQRRRVLRAAGAALRSCARLAGGSQLAAALAEEALRDLLAGGPAPGAEAAVEVLAAVGPCLRPREDGPLLERVAQAALALALAADGDGGEAGPAEDAAALAAGRLLPALGQCGGAALRAVWDGLGAAGAPPGPGRVGPQLLVLSALAERLLPEPGADRDPRTREEGPDARRCWRFWRTVQAGLAQAQDALTRKRARYLLQRAVEVSAELGARCACGPQEGNGPSLFWWSEKKKDELLKFWENYILIMETLEGNQIHVIKPVLPKLNSLFEYAVSEENGSFLLKCIQKMSSRHWCAIPILFLSKALANVPRCKALGIEALLALRDVLQCTMITHQILLRGAAQCYLLQTAMNLVDVEKVSLSDISTFLMCLRQEESLGRGTSLWTELCDWLRVNENCFRRASDCSCVGLPETSSLNAYVKNLVQEYMKSPALETGENCFMPDWFEAKLIAMMVLLAVDVEGMKSQYSEKRRTQNVLRIFLDPLLESLMKLGTNAYMPLLKTDRCLQLLVKLLHTCMLKGSSTQDDEVFTLLQNFVMSTAESISEFILRRLTMNELSSVSDLDRCHLYLMVLTELINLHLKVGWKRGSPIWRVISPLKNASIRHLQEMDHGQEPTLGTQVQRVISMAALATVCEATDRTPELQLGSLEAGPTERFLSALPLNHTLQKPHAEEESSLCEESSSSQGWGKIVAQYIHDQWVCLSFLLKKYHTLIPTSEGEILEPILPAVQMPVRTLQAALEALTVLPSDQVLPVFHCMKILVPKLLTSSESLCVESFDMAWKIISALSNTQLVFWSNLKAFVQFVFDTKVLTTAAKIKGQAYFKIKEIMYKIIEMSAIKTGVFNTLISYCCKSWIVSASNVSQVSLSTAKNYSELVLEACIFGTVFRRDQRLIQDVQTYIENLGHDCAANTVIENTKREDHYVRICAVKFLCLLDGSNMSHKLFVEDLAIKLLDKDELVSKSRTRYYVNSQQHRVKNRIWQALLVILPRFDQNFLNRIIDRIFRAGFINNQASIKYFIEWIIILILHKFPQFLPKFWDCFSYGEENLKTSICTFLSVLSHLDIITQNVPEKKPILKQAFIIVLQWCFSHNFSIRLYALVALKKIWSMCKTWHVEEFDALTSVIESSLSQVENMPGAGNAKKNWQRIQEHFFFETFHPLKDYCLETIFYILPRLSGLVEDEWIAIGKFTRFTDIPLDSGFQWYLSPTQLCERKPGDWAQQDIGSNSGEADDQSEWTDVQKKIIPWKNNVPDLDLELVFQDRVAKLGKSISRLIVVASLIDKPTNLGGLCRTCEVFGASALTVGSLQCTRDKQFQCLSVSAEQWLPLVEVRPPQLIDFLQQKKSEGYTVIGVEQTARSVDLTQYSFPERSLLLLGNEREGIPANLIQQLDVCVEIPQQGIIRSLNVHVSGALLIWEYTRQQLLKHGDTES
ncbi:probable methyltransferase TARBP1 isoform X4 [Leopardus geoffroyi]|uniref:probable methyltransferase TARBP1 isoform X4 n=1 Tax=Leopardus geoffroyi TaxID=46844 RepID=UPI001E25DAD6|nr:probable methyltransferase TARBP1 isoform X4 [Leopardus geoffroyi]